jgi:hypothetical protein
MIKIRGDQCWRDLTCMNYHYQVLSLISRLSIIKTVIEKVLVLYVTGLILFTLDIFSLQNQPVLHVNLNIIYPAIPTIIRLRSLIYFLYRINQF